MNIQDALLAFANIIILSITIEAITELFTPSFPDAYRWLKPYIALVVALVICYAYSGDILGTVGLQPGAQWAWLPPIITALITARGANFVNVFWKRLHAVQAPVDMLDDLPDPPVAPAASRVSADKRRATLRPLPFGEQVQPDPELRRLREQHDPANEDAA